jgi:H+/Cl- antiporter ClcA
MVLWDSLVTGFVIMSAAVMIGGVMIGLAYVLMKIDHWLHHGKYRRGKIPMGVHLYRGIVLFIVFWLLISGYLVLYRLYGTEV